MIEAADVPTEATPARNLRPARVSGAYRQGLITAITVLLGFSLAFLRFWSFEAAGHWTWPSATSAATSILAVVLQVIALFRSLRLEDDDASEYRKTVRWFLASAVVILLGFFVALVESALG